MEFKKLPVMGASLLLFSHSLFANQAPIVSQPIPDQSYAYGESISLDLTQSRATFSDPDRERLTLSVTFSDDIGLTAGNRNLRGVINKVQDITVSVTATDAAGLQVTDEFNIIPNPLEDAGFSEN